MAHRDKECGLIRRGLRSAKADCSRMHSARPAMGMAASLPELHAEQELQQSCTACIGAKDSKGLKCLLLALPYVICPALQFLIISSPQQASN